MFSHHNNNTIRSKNYTTRVAHGRKVEQTIKDHLCSNGYVITDSTLDEDMYDKIDGYITIDHVVQPLQIKYRETGNDIVFEVSFINKNDETLQWNGRDMCGKSTIYACLSQNGDQIWLCDTNHIKYHARTMGSRLYDGYRLHGARSLSTKQGEIKITIDHASKRTKMIFFAKPTRFAFTTIHVNHVA